MLEPQNIKPEPISKDDAAWFKSLFFECFDKEESWLKHLNNSKYKAFHTNKQAFIFTYTVEDQTDILTIGVAKCARNQGLALSLIDWVIVNSPRGQKIFLEVEATNLVAINLYKKSGFQQISIRKDYYQKNDGTTIDALVMSYQ